MLSDLLHFIRLYGELSPRAGMSPTENVEGWRWFRNERKGLCRWLYSTFIGRRLPQTLLRFLHGRFLGKCLENSVSSSMSPAEKNKRNAIFIGRFQSYKYTGQGTLSCMKILQRDGQDGAKACRVLFAKCLGRVEEKLEQSIQSLQDRTSSSVLQGDSSPSPQG